MSEQKTGYYSSGSITSNFARIFQIDEVSPDSYIELDSILISIRALNTTDANISILRDIDFVTDEDAFSKIQQFTPNRDTSIIAARNLLFFHAIDDVLATDIVMKIDDKRHIYYNLILVAEVNAGELEINFQYRYKVINKRNNVIIALWINKNINQITSRPIMRYTDAPGEEKATQ